MWHSHRKKLFKSSSDFHNVAANSFYSRKSAAPDICKYVLLLRKEGTSDRGTEGGCCKENKMHYINIYISPQNINNNLCKYSKTKSDIVSFLWAVFS